MREQIQETSVKIKRLGDSTQEIAKIVSLIDDITDQTNILALNASIQASIAGDAGKGFAVVAEEVQRLAERSSKATRQIEMLVHAIQSDTNDTMTSMEQATQEVVLGTTLAKDAGVALEEIENVSLKLAQLIQKISMAPEEVEARQVLAVPTVLVNGAVFDQGRMTLEQIIGKLNVGAAAREAERIDGEDPYDVLVVGGGPAGAAAAIYAARKGIRTGLAFERFGGQVLDTMAIEIFISVPHTEGPKLAAALEQHVKDYEVDVMDRQRAKRLVPADEQGGLATVELESGATLQARTVVLSTGARWRQMGVPGEDEYRNKGVTG